MIIKNGKHYYEEGGEFSNGIPRFLLDFPARACIYMSQKYGLDKTLPFLISL